MQKRSVPAIMEEGTAAAPVEVVGSGPTRISSLGASSLFLSFFVTETYWHKQQQPPQAETPALVILNDSES